MGKRKSGRDVHGIVLLDKRLGVSSNQALQEVRRLYNANKAGHAGCLDPLATGLLVLCLGEATKVSGLLLDHDKRYQVTVRLGVMTDTGDAEGRVIETGPVPMLTLVDITACLQHFIGDIEQVPPMYSALKHQGQKLYELARAGKTVARAARRIRISALTLLDFTGDRLTLEVACSKGTYIRTLAEDLSRALGCPGTVEALRRLSVGAFDIADAKTIEALSALNAQGLLARLIAVDQPLAAIPPVYLNAEQAARLRQGQAVAWSGQAPGAVRLYQDALFLGLGEMLLDAKIAPKKLFNLNEFNLNNG